jgi:hypothetical protein
VESHLRPIAKFANALGIGVPKLRRITWLLLNEKGCSSARRDALAD